MATPFASGSQLGSFSAQPSGSCAGASRSSSSLRSGLACAHASKACCHSLVRGLAALADLAGVGEHLVVDLEVCSGSKPRISLTAATSSSPSAAPCALPVFILFGAG